MIDTKPCLFCGEEKQECFSQETRGDVNFTVCGSCKGAAPVYQWQHPVSQSQVCLICAGNEIRINHE